MRDAIATRMWAHRMMMCTHAHGHGHGSNKFSISRIRWQEWYVYVWICRIKLGSLVYSCRNAGRQYAVRCTRSRSRRRDGCAIGAEVATSSAGGPGCVGRRNETDTDALEILVYIYNEIELARELRSTASTAPPWTPVSRRGAAVRPTSASPPPTARLYRLGRLSAAHATPLVSRTSIVPIHSRNPPIINSATYAAASFSSAMPDCATRGVARPAAHLT